MERLDLRTRIASPAPILCPGIYDALSAVLVEQAGFEAAYLSGASIAYTKLGAPDIGLVSLTEVAETLSMISDRVRLPVIVDADNGFGNALNVQRTVRLFERAGAAALQLEDQDFPKRCGHLGDKRLIPAAGMVGKIRAAVDTRSSALIIARTDAIAVEGFDQAIERAERYRDAGADILFVEAPTSLEQMEQIVVRLGGGTPLLANMVEGGLTPVYSAAQLGAIGFRVVIFPGGTVRALTRGLQEYFAVLKQDETTTRFKHRMLDFDGLNAVIGTPRILEAAKRYDPDT